MKGIRKRIDTGIRFRCFATELPTACKRHKSVSKIQKEIHRSLGWVASADLIIIVYLLNMDSQKQLLQLGDC